jgi:predicted component of type VI protein secretion system
VILILEVTSPQSTRLDASRQTFSREGGSIGRDSDNAWVLPHSKVSGHHALISYRDAGFYIEDTSRNGVCLNSSRNRLVRGQPYALQSGDRILIDPYEIRVSITDDPNDAARHVDQSARTRPPDVQFDASNPFSLDDPFTPRPSASSGLDDNPEESMARQELDPLALLDLAPPQRPPALKAPSAKDLERGSPVDAHFKPPAVVPTSAPAPPPVSNASTIPDDYDPLADEASSIRIPRRAAPPPSSSSRRVAAEREPNREPAPPLPQIPAPPPPVRPRVDIPEPPRHQAPAAPPPSAAPVQPVPQIQSVAPVTPGAGQSPAVDFAAVLEGAGLDPAAVTPELARAFGQILRVVVSGVMDVMRSRQQIKDEFRMRMTRFRTAENNPLKFSANVEDALHNLLVKRNPAYLGPVEAFEDAFDDLRNHQLAMLAGMRVAFESMLAEFDPDRLQQEFDRQLNKGLVPAKLRYWDLYRERRQDIVKDPEASFRRLFGEAFARAYEEQLKQLKTRERK